MNGTGLGCDNTTVILCAFKGCTDASSPVARAARTSVTITARESGTR